MRVGEEPNGDTEAEKGRGVSCSRSGFAMAFGKIGEAR